MVEIDKLQGATTTIGGVTVGANAEFDNGLSVGVLLPLDYVSSTHDAFRVGAVFYGQYDYIPAPGWSIKPTLYANYLYDMPSGSGRTLPAVGILGGGVGTSVTYDSGMFIPALIVLASYNQDSSNAPGDYQTLIAAGPRFGYRPTDDIVVSVAGMYNQDISAYIPSAAKANYWDAEFDVAYRVSQSFKLDAAYQKTLGIRGFSSNRFLIGGRFAL